MVDYKNFVYKLKNKLPKKISEEPILRIQTGSIEEIQEKASSYFNMPIENLNFEIETITSSANTKQYSVITYPKVNYLRQEFFGTNVDNKDGMAIVRFDESGNILLLVAPAVGEGKNITFDSVIDKVYQRIPSTISVNASLVKKIVLAAENKWSFIATYPYDVNNDVKYSVSFSEDEMVAFLYMIPPGVNGADPSRKKIRNMLYAEGVVYGIDDNMLTQLEYMPCYNEAIAVAYGKEVQHGEDAWIKLISSFDKKEVQKRYDLAHTLTLVKQGDIVAEKVPLTYGSEGYTVTNNEIFPEPGNDVVMVSGKNVKLSPDGNSVVALKDGAVKLIQGKKVSVEDLLVIDSSLSLEIGNINFPGSVLIKGDIPDDFEITVGGSLQVYGGISNSNIHVDGNLTVGHGIKGRGNAQIYVGGNMFAKFIESANLSIDRDCFVEQSIISSQILVKGRIVVVSGRGKVMSSTLTAGMDIFVRSIGSELGESSILEIKSRPKLRKLYEQLIFTKREKIKELNSLKHFLGEEDYALIRKFSSMDSNKNTDDGLYIKYEAVKKTVRSIQNIQRELKGIVQKLKVLNGYLIKEKSIALLHVIQDIKEGTVISIDNARITTKNDLQQVVFYLNDEKISVRDYNLKSDTAKLEQVLNSVK